MIKSELVERISGQNPHLYQRDVENIVNAILDEIIAAMARGDRVELRGGTGRTIDWTRAASIAAARRTLLSGGLTPENIASAIGAVRPFGVDVSSGVESAPGVKNVDKIAAFLQATAR